jgi:hypothetical protein
MDVARIPQSNNQVENIDAITELLWYNVFATNDGIDKLGGQPFDNRGRIYTGSDNDIQLNREVARYRADLTALFEMNRYYQTSGKLTAPLVMLHTTDPVIPFWHELIYSFKVAREERQDHHTSLPLVGRYGHCNFTTAQLLFGFVVLLFQVTGEAPADAERVLKTEEQRQEFRKLLETYPLDFNSDITLHNTWLPLLPNGSPEWNTTATGD